MFVRLQNKRISPTDRAKYLKFAIKKGLKLLSWDVETSHMVTRTFYIGNKVFLSHNSIKVPSKVISIQYKWSHESKVKYLVWDKISTKYDDARNFDDSKMIEEFVTNVLSRADVVLTQNGDKFDFMVLNERAKALKLSTLDQKPSLDILKLSRKSFRAASHKLDYRSQQQGLGGKISMVDQDWVDIEERNVPAEKKMIPYGCKDTKDTEDLMWDELPYYKDLPAKVEQTILKFINDSNEIPSYIKCYNCRKQHRSSKELAIINHKVTCKNCKGTKMIKAGT